MSCIGCTINNSASNLAIDSYDWLNDLPDTSDKSDIVEVKFKTTRREYFSNSENLDIKRGDKIVVATSPGHDMGEVTLTGYLAEKQFHRKVKNSAGYKLNSVYRKATPNDLKTLQDARDREKPTMIRARQIVNELELDMKIGDVEFRGDNRKAIFYYLADGRVDFRELIKLYAREFGINVEMKQIGARQEAGIVGGIGSCGRELCCSTWLTNFKSVTTNTARTQQLSLNPQKLAGQCGKLKCCLNYENPVYLDALKEFPNQDIVLKTSKGDAFHQKTDIFKKMMWYSYVNDQANLMALTIDKVKEIITLNRAGKLPAALEDLAEKREQKADFGSSAIEEEDINRFDKMEKKQKNRGNNQRNNQRRR